jgi:hypothetical protein
MYFAFQRSRAFSKKTASFFTGELYSEDSDVVVRIPLLLKINPDLIIDMEQKSSTFDKRENSILLFVAQPRLGPSKTPCREAESNFTTDERR